MKRATVTLVVPSKIEDDGWGKLWERGNYCIVTETETGKQHALVNGSINGLLPEDRVVGTQGVIEWSRSSSYSLPFFHADTAPAS